MERAQRTIRERPPAHSRNAFDVVARKGQSQPRIHAFVKEDAHSFICSPASSKKR
jgi:hypothetical protein